MPKAVTKKSKRVSSTKPVAKIKPTARAAKKSSKSHKSPLPPEASAKGGLSPKSPRASGVSVSVLSTEGKPAGKMTLPGELFATKVNTVLMAQAVRVYLANQREGSAHTKTRGEVEGSTRKIYRQKGTGRARHGAIRAPIFVGGGIVFGPQSREFRLDFPKKMKRAALASALASALGDGKIIVVAGLSDLAPKTKIMANALDLVGATGSTLLVVSKGAHGVIRAARNIEGVDILPVQNLHTYSVISHQKLVFMKEAL